MEKKWKKHRIGKLYGDTVFIELPPGLSGSQEVNKINQASLFLEEASRNADFLRDMRDMLGSKD